MDCREFRDNHAPYIDQRLSADDENEMRRHAQQCVRCAAHDTRVRRSLILVRSLPTIEPSPDFQARLNSRLRALPPAGVVSEPPIRSFAAIAASVVFVAYFAAELLMRSAPTAIQLAPVVASVPERAGDNSQVATPAMVATVPSGMSVFPALMVASQSVHFVAAELATER
jgi:hypothetical protein